jgi:hypothetical protein
MTQHTPMSTLCPNKPKDSLAYEHEGQIIVVSTNAIEAFDSSRGFLVAGQWLPFRPLTGKDEDVFATICRDIWGDSSANFVLKRLRKEQEQPVT